MVTAITEPKALSLPSIELRSNGTTSDKDSSRLEVTRVNGFSSKSSVSSTRGATKIDRAGFARDDVREAILFASRLLKENPRQVKRFINLFRLQVYIADERGILSDDPRFGLTPMTLGIWVAWYMQWQEILKALASPELNLDVCKNLVNICQYLSLTQTAGGEQTEWTAEAESGSTYLISLKQIRDKEKESISHWSSLPWHFWVRDMDFLHCIKRLERYWSHPELLTSLLDMTQAANLQDPNPESINQNT